MSIIHKKACKVILVFNKKKASEETFIVCSYSLTRLLGLSVFHN